MTQKSASTFTPKILRLLDGLNRNEQGSVVFQHIQHLLEGYDSTRAEIEDAYTELLCILLEGYANLLPDQSAEKIHLRLLQKRLVPPLTVEEFAMLRKAAAEFAQRIPARGPDGASEVRAIVNPVLESLGITTAPAAPVPSAPVEQSRVSPPAPEPEPQSREPQPRTPPEPRREPDTAARSQMHSPVDSAYRKHLESNRERVQRIQQSLAEQISEAVTKNEEFGVLLEVELEALRQAADIDELEALRQTLIDEIQKLLDGHRTLSRKLDSTKEYLQIIEHDSKQLNEELTRVHLLSLTDELTDLPNRRAFMRRLEDEVSRVQRYGSPLTIALIDLDSFKTINDRYGHPAGDEVLRAFALNVLSIFRHHDMVARIGGEEFGVLLPNTDQHGAMKALAKVRTRAAGTTTQIEDAALPMNTFSAGVAIYKPGETVSTLIERADSALYQAKRLGRNRIELASPDIGETLHRS